MVKETKIILMEAGENNDKYNNSKKGYKCKIKYNKEKKWWKDIYFLKLKKSN